MRLFATGDIHGTHSIQKLYKDRWPEGHTLTKEDILLVAGDLGAVWNGGPDDLKAQKRYSSFPFTTVAVLGNHENYTLIDRIPKVKKFGGTVRKVNDSLFLLETNGVYKFGDYSLFAFGGGLSIDKDYRVPGKSWWPEEIPSYETFCEAIKIAKAIGKVDLILTHAIFQSSFDEIPRKFGLTPFDSPKFQDPLLHMLEALKGSLEYKQWFCGHYHIDYVDELNKVQYLYHDIVEIGV